LAGKVDGGLVTSDAEVGKLMLGREARRSSRIRQWYDRREREYYT
jgi:hypothetical protein